MKRKLMAIALFAIMVAVFTACGPYHEDIYVDLKPSETGFVVSLEQGSLTAQKQLKSIEYFEQKKVAAKRIPIPTVKHDNGRGAASYIWIPTVKVIVVDRAPVTREWRSEPGQGTSKKNEEIQVESENSIGFAVGITCTASIPEEDASTYLYWYGEKKLSEVMDDNVRSFVLDNLTGAFGSRDLTHCQKERKVVFDSMKVQTARFFAARGVRLDNIGAAGEFRYIEPEIQTAINLQFVAEKKKDAAVNEVAAANLYATAAQAIKAQKELDANINLINSLADAVKNGKLTWPNTLVLGQNQSLMDIWGAKNLGNMVNQATATTKPKK